MELSNTSSLSVAFGGDFVPSNITAHNLASILSSIEQQLLARGVNHFLFNLEASLPASEKEIINTGSSIVAGNTDVFSSAIKYIHTNLICSLANNHIVDFGFPSLQHTIHTLNSIGIESFGAGSNPLSARQPHILELHDLRLGFLAFCSTRKCVGDHLKTQIASPISLIDEDTIPIVRNLSEAVDHVIVLCHWGREFVHYPIPEDREIAHAIIDAGASLVIGHHPHVLQGYEKYNSGSIFYSLGNFVFPDQEFPQRLRWSKTERTGSLALFTFTKNSFEFNELIPFRVDSNTITIFSGINKRRLLNKIDKWSIPFSSGNYGIVYEFHARMAALSKIARGVMRNIRRPKLRHFTMLYRLMRQAICGRRSFIK